MPGAKIEDVTIHFEVGEGEAPSAWEPYEGDIRMMSNGFIDLLDAGQMVAPHRIETITYPESYS